MRPLVVRGSHRRRGQSGGRLAYYSLSANPSGTVVLQPYQIGFAIFIRKNILAPVAPLRDVVRRMAENGADKARHAAS